MYFQAHKHLRPYEQQQKPISKIIYHNHQHYFDNLSINILGNFKKLELY